MSSTSSLRMSWDKMVSRSRKKRAEGGKGGGEGGGAASASTTTAASDDVEDDASSAAPPRPHLGLPLSNAIKTASQRPQPVTAIVASSSALEDDDDDDDEDYADAVDVSFFFVACRRRKNW
jgi:hypothetical protein